MHVNPVVDPKDRAEMVEELVHYLADRVGSLNPTEDAKAIMDRIVAGFARRGYWIMKPKEGTP